MNKELLEELDKKLHSAFRGGFRIDPDTENLLYIGEFFEDTGEKCILHTDELVLMDLSKEENLEKIQTKIEDEEYKFFQKNWLDEISSFCDMKHEEYEGAEKKVKEIGRWLQDKAKEYNYSSKPKSEMTVEEREESAKHEALSDLKTDFWDDFLFGTGDDSLFEEESE